MARTELPLETHAAADGVAADGATDAEDTSSTTLPKYNPSAPHHHHGPPSRSSTSHNLQGAVPVTLPPGVSVGARGMSQAELMEHDEREGIHRRWRAATNGSVHAGGGARPGAAAAQSPPATPLTGRRVSVMDLKSNLSSPQLAAVTGPTRQQGGASGGAAMAEQQAAFSAAARRRASAAEASSAGQLLFTRPLSSALDCGAPPSPVPVVAGVGGATHAAAAGKLLGIMASRRRASAATDPAGHQLLASLASMPSASSLAGASGAHAGAAATPGSSSNTYVVVLPRLPVSSGRLPSSGDVCLAARVLPLSSGALSAECLLPDPDELRAASAHGAVLWGHAAGPAGPAAAAAAAAAVRVGGHILAAGAREMTVQTDTLVVAAGGVKLSRPLQLQPAAAAAAAPLRTGENGALLGARGAPGPSSNSGRLVHAMQRRPSGADLAAEQHSPALLHVGRGAA